MPNTLQLIWRRLRANGIRLLGGNASGTEAAQIVELAITLPLLMALLVGIYDFGQAFNLKQKLAGAAREGARFASSQSTSDLSNSSPASLLAVRDVVDSYLTSNNVNDLGLATATPGTPTNWTWTFPGPPNPGPPLTCATDGQFTLTINRGFSYNVANGGNIVTIEATQVTLSYPYQWQFNRVIKLVVGSASYAATSCIVSSAAMQNLN
jgi:Flp pilus assembly protein TadG